MHLKEHQSLELAQMKKYNTDLLCLHMYTQIYAYVGTYIHPKDDSVLHRNFKSYSPKITSKHYKYLMSYDYPFAHRFNNTYFSPQVKWCRDEKEKDKTTFQRQKTRW